MANDVAVVAAFGSMTSTKNLAEGDAVKVGSEQYFITATVANTANNVLLGADETATLANIIKAVNGTGTSGTTYHTATAQPNGIVASLLSTHVIRFTASLPGAQGNNFAVREVTDGGTAFSTTAFTSGSGDLAGASGFITRLMALTEVSAEVQTELKKLTLAAD